MPHRGQNFPSGYTPRLGDIVHLDWAPAVGHEMTNPHYGLVLSADKFNVGTGLCVVVPITSKVGKLSGFELSVQAGRVNGAAILSALRSIDYQTRNVQFEDTAASGVIAEANRRICLFLP
jgi:mRNA-degrading endonuclease toxin of MazEF toxin-antitoxin module